MKKKYFCEKCEEEVIPSDPINGTFWNGIMLIHKKETCFGKVEEE